MSRANIINGIWARRVTWSDKRGGRTDIPISVLTGSEAKAARYVLPSGDTVTISMDEMRRALKQAPRRAYPEVAGPFNIDPLAQTVFGVKVRMTVNLRKLNNK